MSEWNYYNQALRNIGISNETQDVGAWIGKPKRKAKAYCNSKHCTKDKVSKVWIKHYEEDETCPHCGSYLFFSSKSSG